MRNWMFSSPSQYIATENLGTRLGNTVVLTYIKVYRLLGVVSRPVYTSCENLTSLWLSPILLGGVIMYTFCTCLIVVSCVALQLACNVRGNSTDRLVFVWCIASHSCGLLLLQGFLQQPVDRAARGTFECHHPTPDSVSLSLQNVWRVCISSL